MKKILLFIVVLMILAGCTNLPVTKFSENITNTVLVPTETPEPKNTTPILVEDPTDVTVTHRVLPLSRIDLFIYAGGEYIGEVRDGWFSKESVITSMKRWEFSEHGETAEYCYDATATFHIQREFPGMYYSLNILLKPPQLRSLLKVFDKINEGGYLIEVTENNIDIKVGNVVDESGNIIWSENIWEDPADLTPIEKALLDYRHRVDVYHYHLDYTKTESSERYLDSGICLEYLNEKMEWENTEFEPIKNEGIGKKYVFTSHQEDNWSILEIAARNAFAYDKIIRNDQEQKLILLSSFDLPVCYDISDRDKYPFPFSLFDSNNNELPCGKKLLTRGWPIFHIITVPKDGYVKIKDYENETWDESLTINLHDRSALLKYATGNYPWRFEVDYLDAYFNTYGGDGWSPDLSELTLDYPEEEIVEYLNSLDN